MGMKIDSDEENIMAEINMTPLIDIMLVLLIIFMVTSSISLESGLNIELPNTSNTTTKQEGDIVIVSLDAKGNLSVQGQKTNSKDFIGKVKQAISEAGNSTVIFEGDENASLGETIKIMDMAKDAGADSFAIAAESD